MMTLFIYIIMQIFLVDESKFKALLPLHPSLNTFALQRAADQSTARTRSSTPCNPDHDGNRRRDNIYIDFALL